MNIETIVRILQDRHVRGITNELQLNNKWRVRIYDNSEQDVIELQLIKRSCGSDTILLKCPAWWRCDYVAEVFEKAIKLYDYGNERDSIKD